MLLAVFVSHLILYPHVYSVLLLPHSEQRTAQSRVSLDCFESIHLDVWTSTEYVDDYIMQSIKASNPFLLLQQRSELCIRLGSRSVASSVDGPRSKSRCALRFDSQPAASASPPWGTPTPET